MPKNETRPDDWPQEWPWIPDITDEEVELIRAETRAYNALHAIKGARAKTKTPPPPFNIRERMAELETRDMNKRNRK